MARMIDLDLVAREPIQIRLQGKTFSVHEPTLEQLLRRDNLLKRFEKETAELEGKTNEDNQELSSTFDYQLLCIFLSWLTEDIYRSLTLGQKKGLYNLIFEGDTEEKKIEEKAQE